MNTFNTQPNIIHEQDQMLTSFDNFITEYENQNHMIISYQHLNTEFIDSQNLNIYPIWGFVNNLTIILTHYLYSLK